MKIVLLSGGSGKRLWPLSSELLPKQFLRVIKDTSGRSISMVQRSWRLLSSIYGEEAVYIAAPESHCPILREQLGEGINLILEPESRDTFPAIMLAAAYLENCGGAGADETIIVLPVDTYAEPSFFTRIGQLDRIIQEDQGRLALVGVQPSQPSEKYGYIQAELDSDGFGSVIGFYEKPDYGTAIELIEQGALWNGGIFAFKLEYARALRERLGYPATYAALAACYSSLPRISFDYMVAEQEKTTVCLHYTGIWSDLGTWNDMLRLLEPASYDAVIMDDDSEGTFVINQLGIPIIVAGIANAVIAAGPDGILISNKNVSHAIKPLVDRIGS